MTTLCVPLHPDWTGQESISEYLRRIQCVGVGAVELQLPPMLSHDAVPMWHEIANHARCMPLKLALHAPITYDRPVWNELIPWIQESADQTPVVLIVHGVAMRSNDASVQATVSFVRSLCDRLPSTVTVAVETGWNLGARLRLSARWRHWRHQRHQQRLQRQRPMGVGSGMGVASAQHQPHVANNHPVDPPLDADRWHPISHTGNWISTGTRASTLRIVDQIDRTNCVIAWDLAHDWLSGAWDQIEQADVPDEAFLHRIGYVRVHDALANGLTHLPLMAGNVPYASQLRALSRIGFDGIACVAVRYTEESQLFGSRWHVLERSLTMTRQGLRIPYQQ